jgi:ParB family chromosome partitioning protein
MMNKRRSGLGSLIPGSELIPEGTLEQAPVAAIAVNPYQPRRVFAPEALEELAESIRQYGVLQPLAVRRREGGYELIAGERRLQAARKAGLYEVPVTVRDCSDEEMLALALVENLQREDLNALEAARSYHQLTEEFGLSQAEVADRVGKSRSAVANTLRLLALPAPIQQAVAEGGISEGHARALLAIGDPARQTELFKETLAKGLSVRALEACATAGTKQRKERKKSPAPAMDANLLQVQEELQRVLGTRVRFKPGSTATGGALEIEYYNAGDLDQLYDALSR